MSKKILSIVVAILCLFSVSLIGFPAKVKAADFDTHVTYAYEIHQEGPTKVIQTTTYTNNTSSYFVSKGAEQKFYIFPLKKLSTELDEELLAIEETIELFDGGGVSLGFTVKNTGTYLEISTTFPKNLIGNQTAVFELTYESNQIAEHVGNVINFFLPGYPKDIENIQSLGEVTTQTTYATEVRYDASLGKATFVAPSPSYFEKEEDQYVIRFSTEDLTHNAAWIQIGDVQYYSFKMHQKVGITNNPLSKIFKTRYTLLLPSNLANQKVFYTRITPSPVNVTLSDEGNLIAEFEFGEIPEQDIEIEGTMELTLSHKGSLDEGNPITQAILDTEYTTDEEGNALLYKDLLSQQEFWEVDAQKIQSQADILKGSLTDPVDIIKADYQFVVDHVDYDDLKLTLGNQRQGALKTLEGGSSVCMEYSDLLITLLRAQGIPSRAAFGYTYDPRDDNRQGAQSGHQWVEAYVEPHGWVSIDPTWGDSGRRTYIGEDIDHAYWYVTGEDVFNPSQVTRKSIFDSSELEDVSFSIIAQKRESGPSGDTQDKLLSQYQKSNTFIPFWDELTKSGKLLFVGLISVLLITLLSLVGQLFKKNTKEIPVN